MVSVHELLVVLVFVLVFFGSKKLPEIGNGLGRAIRNFKQATSEPDEIDITPKEKKKSSANVESDSEE